MQYLRLLISISLVVLNFISCAPSVTFVADTPQREPKPDEYEMLYISRGDRLSGNSIILGRISVYDAGIGN